MSAPTLPPSIAIDEFLTLDQLAERLKMSPKTLHELKRDGLPLRRITPRGTVYVFWSEVAAWLKKRKSPTYH